MRTAIIEKTVYSVEDAMKDESLMEKIMLKNWDYDVQDFGWWDRIYDLFEIDLIGTGFEKEKIYFSGFSSQGDGAMFVGSFTLNHNSDPVLIAAYIKDKRIAAMIKAGRVSVSCDFKHYGHYYHHRSYTNSFVVETYGNHHTDNNITNYLESGELEESICDEYETLCKKLYRDLEKEYNYLTSEEYLMDYFKQNNTEFYADGEIFYE